MEQTEFIINFSVSPYPLGHIFVLLIGILFIGMVFIVALEYSRKRYLKMMLHVKSLEEHLIHLETNGSINPFDKNSFDTEINEKIIPVLDATISFITMYYSGEKKILQVIILLKSFKVDEIINTIIRIYLNKLQTAQDFADFKEILSKATAHADTYETSQILHRLIHPDTYLKIKEWKAVA